MTVEVITLVKMPITEIEEWVRTKHTLPKVLTEFRIEENDLLLFFNDGERQKERLLPKVSTSGTRGRKARRKRNRMKTRGWKIVSRITNSKGQKCSIYRPFVEALKNSNLPKLEQKKLVEKILKSNRNKPSEASIQYFLENTLEYLEQDSGLHGSSGGKF